MRLDPHFGMLPHRAFRPVGGRMTYEGGKDDPPPSPDYSAVMQEDMKFRREQYESMKPLIERSIASGEKASDRMMQMMEENVAREKEQYDRQKAAFAPTELQVAADAYGQQYLSAEEKAQLREAVSPDSTLSEEERNRRLSAFGDLAEKRASTEAMGQTQAAANMAASQQTRMLGRLGANPAKMAAISQRMQNEQALNLAGAGNSARNMVRDKGVGMRANLANMGRGFINTSAQLGSLATQQGQAAGSALSQGIGNVTAGGAGMNQGFSNQVNTMGKQFDSEMSSWKAKSDQQASTMQGIGQMAGMATMFMSSKDSKTGRRAVDDSDALEGVKRVPVESWRYKGDDQRHVGPMAEDMQRELGDDVAPGGKQIDAVSMLGVHQAAIRELGRKVDELQGSSRRRYRPQAFKDGGMIRGPGTGTSDSVRAVNGDTGQPIRLSNGEYVLPADTVRRLGKEALDDLVKKTHTPVRRALRS